MAARFAAISRALLLPARIRQLQTLVMVGSTNAQGESSLLATLYADEESKLGMIVREEVIRMRHGLSHPRDGFPRPQDEASISGRPMDADADADADVQPTLEADDPLPCGKDNVAPGLQSGSWEITKTEFYRLRDVYENKLKDDAAEAKRRDERHAAEALARFLANHRFDRLERLVEDGFKALDQEITRMKNELSQIKRDGKGLNVQVDALKGYIDDLKKLKELKEEGKVDKLWVHDAIDRLIKKLPWGLPGVVSGLRSFWGNVAVLCPYYPVVPATYLYVKHSITPMEYFQILVYKHDDLMIKPYLKTIKKVRAPKNGGTPPEDDQD